MLVSPQKKITKTPQQHWMMFVVAGGDFSVSF